MQQEIDQRQETAATPERGSSDQPRIRVERAGPVATVVVSHPRRRNAFTADMLARTDADVVVENWRPDVKQRLGLNYEQLREINPRVILASISGYGQDGPYAMRPGFASASFDTGAVAQGYHCSAFVGAWRRIRKRERRVDIRMRHPCRSPHEKRPSMNMRVNPRRIFIAARFAGALLTALVAGGASISASAQGAGDLITTARLGAVYALSGPIAIYSPPIKNGLEMALADANAKGDFKLEIPLEDDRSTKDEAINVYQKFIQRDKALLIFGPLSGAQSFAAAPLAQRAKVPVMLTSVATPGVTGIGDYVFRTSVESATIIPNTVRMAKTRLGLKKVAQIYTNDDQFTVGEFKAFEAALKANGVEVVTVETIRTGDVDFSAQLTKIKALNPDTLVISSQGQESVSIMTQARKLGMDKIHFLGGNAFNSAGVVKEAGKAMEGALSATPWFLAMPHPKNVDFVARYRQKYGIDPDWLAAQTYDAVFVVKQALLAAQIRKSDDVAVARTKLRDALAAIKSYDGVLGKIDFTPGRDPVLAGAIITVTDGKHVLVK